MRQGNLQMSDCWEWVNLAWIFAASSESWLLNAILSLHFATVLDSFFWLMFESIEFIRNAEKIAYLPPLVEISSRSQSRDSRLPKNLEKDIFCVLNCFPWISQKYQKTLGHATTFLGSSAAARLKLVTGRRSNCKNGELWCSLFDPNQLRYERLLDSCSFSSEHRHTFTHTSSFNTNG